MKKSEEIQNAGNPETVGRGRESGKKAIYETKDGKVVVTSQELYNSLPTPVKSALKALISVGAAEVREVTL